MAIDSNNDNSKITGVGNKNVSDIRNNNLDFSLAEVILKSPLGKDILSNMVINNKSLLTEKDIIGFKIDEVLKKLKKIEQDITVNNINEMRRCHKNDMRRG